MKDIVIIGSGGFAKEVAFLIDEINSSENKWNILGFIDNTNDNADTTKYKIYNNDDWLKITQKELAVAIGLGNPKITKKILGDLSINNKSNIFFPNLIHPSVIGDFDRIKLGVGNVICAGSILTTDIKIGNFNIINLACTIGHDSTLGSYNVINPTVNISGGVTISDCCLVGTGSQVLQYKSIVDNAIVGAGSVVTKNISEAGIYVGIPAKKLK